MFKKLEINIPFAEALAQMPHYAKFMKDIISKKRKLDEGGVVSLSTNCSAIIHKISPLLMQDPSSFTITYTIRNHEFGKALCDSDANIILMPLSIVRRLSLGELTPTKMTLQMENRSMAQLKGILEDLLVKAGKFIFPMDFVVIDIEEDEKIPLLLGRPLLATEVAMIDVKKGELTLIVGTEEVHFNLNQSLKQQDVEEAQFMRVNSILDKHEMQHKFFELDLSKESMINSLHNEDLDGEMLMEKTKLNETILSM